VRLGATPLGALVVGEVGSFGAPCFVRDRGLADNIVQSNGKHPHPRSVARVRRQVVLLGLMDSVRVMPGERPPNARYPTSFGTTAKVVVFTKKFGARDPLSRGQRRKLRLRKLSIEAEGQGESVSRELAQPTGRPRHIAPVPTMPAELAKVVNDLGEKLAAKWERQEQADDVRMMDSVLRPPPNQRGPPG
jgi:hypothetical protein